MLAGLEGGDVEVVHFADAVDRGLDVAVAGVGGCDRPERVAGVNGDRGVMLRAGSVEAHT